MKKSFAIIFCLCMLLISATVLPVSAQEKVSYDEAFGAASGMSLYNTQVVLGMTADGIAKGVYSMEIANGVTREQSAMLGVLNSYVAQLIQSPSTPESDRTALVAISSCIGRLNETINALNAYIQNPTVINADNFQVKRKASYAAIAELLGIKK